MSQPGHACSHSVLVVCNPNAVACGGQIEVTIHLFSVVSNWYMVILSLYVQFSAVCVGSPQLKESPDDPSSCRTSATI